ncbi:MAG TPA: site-2 protease family protein [Acidimicrobiales bacterium]|nr:site-2 protease family protein [Acidimicrobiales bacterium]
MEQNIKLGRIAGVPVGVNWSILVIFVLVAWELAAFILPAYHAHQSGAVYWTTAIATTVVFFVSLVAHEVSHTVVAIRNGIRVRGITLWLFGGVSELESEALSPGADFRIAVVGPLTSLVLAGVFGLVVLAFHGASGNGATVVSALGWLAWMNLLLGLFNLAPAAPLDGGRVLRSILWRRSGDRLRAATSAAHAGSFLGYLLIVFGVIEFLEIGIFGLWFLFLGWFLLTAARAEEGSAVMRATLANVLVRDVMTTNPTTFSSGMTVADLLDRELHRHRFNTYPLVGPSGQLEGLTSMARLRHVGVDRRSTTRLIDTACPLSQVPIGSPDEPVPDLLARMQTSIDGRALVIDPSRHLVGIVTPSDVARFVQFSMVRGQARAPRP